MLFSEPLSLKKTRKFRIRFTVDVSLCGAVSAFFKGMRSKTSIYPVFEVIPEKIGTGSSEDTRTTVRQNGRLGQNREEPRMSGLPW